MTVLHRAPEISVELGTRHCVIRTTAAHACTGFPLVGGALATSRLVAIHEVRNAELPVDVDPVAFATRLHDERVGEPGLVLLTSRALTSVDVRTATSGTTRALALATVGLGNALRIGDPPGPIPLPGTINLVAWVSAPLTLEARLEALTLVAEARTVAVREANVPSRRTGDPSTGTGTDAIVVLSPEHPSGESYAGKHTDVGAALGAAVLSAVTDGIARWRVEIEPTLPPRLGGGGR